MLATLSGDDNSLQRRLFKFSGCKGRPSIDIPRELLEQYLRTTLLLNKLFDFSVSSMTIRRRISEYQLHFEKHSSLTEAELDDVMEVRIVPSYYLGFQCLPCVHVYTSECILVPQNLYIILNAISKTLKSGMILAGKILEIAFRLK